MKLGNTNLGQPGGAIQQGLGNKIKLLGFGNIILGQQERAMQLGFDNIKALIKTLSFPNAMSSLLLKDNL